MRNGLVLGMLSWSRGIFTLSMRLNMRHGGMLSRKIFLIAFLVCFCFSLLVELKSVTSLSSLYYPKMCVFSSYFTSSSNYSRFGYDHYGGYERGGRGGYVDDKSYGRFGHRSAAGYQNGIPGMLTVANSLGSSYIP